MSISKVKNFESLISGQDSLVRHFDRQPSKPAEPVDKAVASSNFQMGSEQKSLRALENGGVASSAEFRTPKFFRS